ncbi:UNVERIFIED_ORG: hypothetical protein J2W85_006755 [Ensifer adhaerens]|nr:hypothetical protein [Ensifer adhaerens]
MDTDASTHILPTATAITFGAGVALKAVEQPPPR